jgi:hypothetical protein
MEADVARNEKSLITMLLGGRRKLLPAPAEEPDGTRRRAS